MIPAIDGGFLSAFNHLAAAFLHYSATPGHLKEKEVHELRLSVKNIRTALDLGEFITGKKAWTKDLRAMMLPVFDRAGEARTARMNLKLLGGEDKPGTREYVAALRSEEAWSLEVLRNLAVNFDRERFERVTADVGSVIAGIEPARVAVYSGKFIGTRYDAIFRILKAVKTSRELHEVRKNVKSARNAIALTSGSGTGQRSVIEERILRSADQTLGAWHDTIILVDRLRGYILRNGRSPWTPGLRILAGTLWKKNEARFPVVVRDTRRRVAALRSVVRISPHIPPVPHQD